MNIAVIAANGRTGQAFVKIALATGHTVRAGSMTIGTFQPHPHLTEVVCDATNEADMMNLISGQDAVASFIGHVKGSRPDVQTVAIWNAVKAMHFFSVTRIVSLTGTGVRFPKDTIPLIDRILNLAIKIIDPARVKDGRDHLDVLQRSRLEWTVIRVLKLSNGLVKPCTLRVNGPTKLHVSRDEVAFAALSVLENHSFVGQAPIISN